MSEQSIVPLEQMLPNKLPLVPLTGRPIFPGVFTPILIGNPPDVKVVEAAAAGDGFIGFAMVNNEADTPEIGDLCQVGTVAKIFKKINLPDGGINAFISTIKRFKIRKTLNPTNPIVVAVEYLEDEIDDDAELKALTRALLSEMKQISENNPLFSEEMRLNMINIDNPGKIADFITSILNIDKAEQQKILEMLNVRRRIEHVLIFIKKEQDILRIQHKIQKEINEKIEKNQREYFLKEELKAIKTELGMAADAKSSDYQRFKEKFEAFKFEGEVKEAVDHEMEKFNLMEANSPEYAVTRNYLDLIASLPWQDPEPETINLAKAAAILEADHFGLKDVKARIVEYLAVRKLRGEAAARIKKDKNERRVPVGSIVCLVGPPGVGKTSVGRSIAHALGKGFFRFSVGGMRDEAEVKGHRRTYIGALPGKIISGLKIVKAKDPVFMIDEIDKLVPAGAQGDPASALLEALDPEQNFSFRDHYLDLPFDISRIFFIVTANTLDTIPGPLRDRMEIIELPGYIDTEKLEIARHYLLPKSLEKSGLTKSQVKHTKESLLHIANGYAREAGVRNFEKNLDKIHRKLAKELVEAVEAQEAAAGAAQDAAADAAQEAAQKAAQKKASTQKAAPVQKKAAQGYVIDRAAIEKYLGKPLFPDDIFKKADKPGMSIGLAWTSMGGDTLIIEAQSSPGKEGFTLTGNMGDTMKESAAIAMSVARKLAIETYGVSSKWFEKRRIHLHIPEGATPKDGPSAGITMATALLSLFLNKVIANGVVMTGELSLTGQVLPIGGLKEKTIAARRNKARRVIIPKQNLRDLDEIPDHVKSSLDFIPVERFEQVLEIVLK
jgi:ATP-dependent Lon protease